jgi:hypothetical protein
VAQHRIQRRLERSRIAVRLGQQHPALECSEQARRQAGGIRVRPQLAPVGHRLQSVAQRDLPALETGRQLLPRLRITLCQLPRQRPEPAATRAVQLDLPPYVRVGPSPQTFEAVQLGRAHHRVGLQRDHGLDQAPLVLEVVRHLRTAHPGRGPDALDAGPGDAALGDQAGRRPDDALPGRLTFAGQPHARSVREKLGCTTQNNRSRLAA